MAKIVMGIAFGPNAIQAAELMLDQKGARLMRAAEFKLDEKDSYKEADALGKKLGEFFKQQKFGSKIAIVGLPTQWLMLKGKKLPKTSAANLSGMLLMQAERDFSLEGKDLVLDYSLYPSTAAATQPAVLAAALRDRVEQVNAVLKAAGVSALALTSSTLQLDALLKSAMLLSVGPFGAELLINAAGEAPVPSVVASTTPPGSAWVNSVAGEVRRTLGLRAVEPGTPVQLLNGAELDAAGLALLEQMLNAPVQVVKSLAGVDTAVLPNAPRFAHAIALARLGEVPSGVALNFLNSKLIEKKLSAWQKIPRWAYAAAALVLLLLGTLIYSWTRDSHERSTLEKAAAAREAELASAKVFLTRYASVQGWYDKRPNPLDVMLALTDVLPKDGSVWVANLSLKDDMHCVLSLRAVDSKNYFEVFTAIDKAPSFKENKLVYMTQPDKKKSEVSFAVSFIFSPR